MPGSLGKAVRYIYKSVIGFVYPPQCVVCEGLHENERYFICAGCERSLPVYDNPFCPHCKNPLDFEEDTCRICGKRKLIDRAWAVGSYDDYFQPLIHAFKYGGMIPVGKFITGMLADLMARNISPGYKTVLVPIPLHPSRRRRRGFNQSDLIASELSSRLEIPVIEDGLFRIRRTKDQTGLDYKRRVSNMRGAFREAEWWSETDSTVILVDDVTTSGATAFEAARTLKEAGVKRIELAVLALAGHDITDEILD